MLPRRPYHRLILLPHHFYFLQCTFYTLQYSSITTTCCNASACVRVSVNVKAVCIHTTKGDKKDEAGIRQKEKESKERGRGEGIERGREPVWTVLEVLRKMRKTNRRVATDREREEKARGKTFDVGGRKEADGRCYASEKLSWINRLSCWSRPVSSC